MTYLTLDDVKQPLQQFDQFDADTQLAILWFGYQNIKEQLMPNPDHKVEDVANAVFDRVKTMSKEEQLNAQRDIAKRADTPVSREYGALSPSSKLEFWLLLAQGMEAGTIINVPDDYQLPEEAKAFTNDMQSLDFEVRINFIRNAVAAMGNKAASIV